MDHQQCVENLCGRDVWRAFEEGMCGGLSGGLVSRECVERLFGGNVWRA